MLILSLGYRVQRMIDDMYQRVFDPCPSRFSGRWLRYISNPYQLRTYSRLTLLWTGLFVFPYIKSEK